MEEARISLQNSSLFSVLPEESLRRYVLPHGQIRQFNKGHFLITPQQRMDQISLILTGRLHILHLFPDGNYSLMGVLGPQRFLGADLIPTKTRLAPYSVMAAADGRLLSLPAELILEPGMLPEPERLKLLMGLMTLIAQENMKKEYRLAILAQKGLRERILTYLTMQAAKQGNSAITIPFSREELASFLCVNRSALSHALSRMQQEGLISFHKNQFVLHESCKGDIPPTCPA